MTFLVLVGYGLLVFTQFIPLYHTAKLRRDFWINVVLGSLSFCLILLLSLDVKVPSPAGAIQAAVFYFIGEPQMNSLQ